MAEKEREDKEEMEETDESGVMEGIRKNPWVVVSLVLLVALVVFVVKGGGLTGNVISGTDAGQNLLDFIKARMGQDATIDSVVKQDGFYSVTFSLSGQKSQVYVSLDGKYIIPSVIPMSEASEGADAGNSGQQQKQPQEISKSDKPKVELFVMTHCPYGTQAEKGLIPAIKALGNKVDAKIRFVHYFMHDPEKEETPRQVCIREEQGDKFLNYLECFLEDGNSENCIVSAKIDAAKLNNCITQKLSDKYYAVDSDLSNGYGVQGSPTLVINGKVADSGRDSASFLKTICSAFNEAPKECSTTTLSGSQPSPGFGYSASGASGGSAAQCG